MDPTCPRPLRKDAERNRRRVLDAAATVFAERGLGASFDEIAERAEVGVGTVYRRFPTKDELIDALFDDQMERTIAIAEHALTLEDPWEAFEHFMQVMAERQACNRGLKEMLLGARMARETDVPNDPRSRMEPLTRELVARAQATGQLRDDIVASDLPLILMMIGAVADYSRAVDPEVWRRPFTVILDGLRAAADRRRPLPTVPLSADGLSSAMSCWRPQRG